MKGKNINKRKRLCDSDRRASFVGNVLQLHSIPYLITLPHTSIYITV